MTDVVTSFRAQQRFRDPMEVVPAEWTAPTPPEGLAPTPPQGLPVPVPTNLPAPVDLSTAELLGAARRGPSEGWRRWLYKGSAGLINLGESPKVLRREALTAQVARPVRGCAPGDRDMRPEASEEIARRILSDRRRTSRPLR